MFIPVIEDASKITFDNATALDVYVTIDYDIAYTRHAVSPSARFDRAGRPVGRIIESERVEGPVRLLPEGDAIVEIKVIGSYPLWLVDVLNACGARPTSFSKYGTAYTKVMEAARKSATVKEAM